MICKGCSLHDEKLDLLGMHLFFVVQRWRERERDNGEEEGREGRSMEGGKYMQSDGYL